MTTLRNLSHYAITVLFTTLLVGSSVHAAQKKEALPYVDGSHVTLTGTVAATEPHGFTMDYGQSTIFVEMDDWDWYDESRVTLPGDKVTITGRIDNDAFETRSIEAGSVYIHGLNAYFYASPADEEGFEPIAPGLNTLNPVGSAITLEGEVAETKDFGSFKIKTGFGTLTVDTTRLGYNPLDNFGFQKIKAGQKVLVSGDIRYEDSFRGLFHNRTIVADKVITLSRDEGRSKTQDQM